jgi:hypothetical protein
LALALALSGAINIAVGGAATVVAAGTASTPTGSTPSAASGGGHKRMVIIDQDAYGPAGSNMQAILLLLQADDVEVLGITITSGDGWRDEEVDHTLRLLEIAGRTEVPVIPGAHQGMGGPVRQAFLQGSMD